MVPPRRNKNKSPNTSIKFQKRILIRPKLPQPPQPSQPTQPAQPSQPTQPAQPSQPTQPAQPSQPPNKSNLDELINRLSDNFINKLFSDFVNQRERRRNWGNQALQNRSRRNTMPDLFSPSFCKTNSGCDALIKSLQKLKF